MIAEKNENINDMIPSIDKIWNNVTSVLKVSKTHFKLHAFEITDAELRANIAQWNGRGNIFSLSCEFTDASKGTERQNE